MGNINFIDNTKISKNLIKNYNKKLEIFVNGALANTKKGYETQFGFLNLPKDKLMIKKIKALCQYYNSAEIDAIIVIGIGGSILGTQAIIESLNGKYFNLELKKKIYFLDNLEELKLSQLMKELEPGLKLGRKVVINLISKSGSTIESISNFEIFIEKISKYMLDYPKYVVITTDKNSSLFNLAEKNNFSVLEIPENIIGRYSVLSPVGLFPLAMAGINIDKIISGANDSLSENLRPNLNNSSYNAILIYLLYHSRKNIYDILLYGSNLENLGKWYRQLIAESLGKEFNKFGNKVNVGITPMVSIGTLDLHSMFQLTMGGPKDKIIQVIRYNKEKDSKIPNYLDYESVISNIQGKSVKQIEESIIKSVNLTLNEYNIPNTQIIFNKLDESSIGYFIMMKQIEIILTAYLLNVNPFDQPNVELYKSKAKSMLKK